MPTRRARFGDVIEVPTPKGLAYAQYATRHPEYGDVIRILPGFFAARPADMEGLVREPGFFAFYPLAVAVSRGMVEAVARPPIPAGIEKPRMLRRVGFRSADGRVHTWVITGDNGDYVREELTPEERRLPIVSIWNHEMLVHQLTSGWHPEQEG